MKRILGDIAGVPEKILNLAQVDVEYVASLVDSHFETFVDLPCLSREQQDRYFDLLAKIAICSPTHERVCIAEMSHALLSQSSASRNYEFYFG